MEHNPSALVQPSPGRARVAISAYRREIIVCLMLILAIWIVFGQTLTFEFLNYDDPTYITGNLLIQDSLDMVSVAETFVQVGISGHWHPLTWISLMVDFHIFGMEPWGFHLTNVLLHTLSTVLLFGALRWATGNLGGSALVAGFFAVHPAHVESVAWITERKDVLSTVFWMLTMLAYLNYVQKPGWRSYQWVMYNFALGLLAKPMVVTLPAVLLLLDYWPLGRFTFVPIPAWSNCERKPWWRLIKEKMPLFALSAGSAAMTIWAMQRGEILRPLTSVTLADRLANSLKGYATYLRILVWPLDLAPVYHMQPWQPVDLVAPAGILAVITLAALILARRRPALLVGWLWYLVTLLPVIGVIQVGSQPHVDRYTYIPYVGLFLAVIWLTLDLGPLRSGTLASSATKKTIPIRWTLHAGFLALLAAAMVGAFAQTRIWRNSIALWEHNQAVTGGGFSVHFGLASAYRDAGRLDDARLQLQLATDKCPNNLKAYQHLAGLWHHLDRPKKAEEVLRTGIQNRPQEPLLYYALCQLLLELGRTAEAERWEAEGDKISARGKT